MHFVPEKSPTISVGFYSGKRNQTKKNWFLFGLGWLKFGMCWLFFGLVLVIFRIKLVFFRRLFGMFRSFDFKCFRMNELRLYYTYTHILSKNLKQEIESKGRFAVLKFRFSVCSELFGKQPGATLLPEKTPTHKTF
jgi:hypothetical protein